jgi:uncharacterized SAM-binding protein YcdF (DUF218 family)
MFFYLSKLLWVVVQPSTLMFAALAVGVLLTLSAWRRLSRGLMFGSVGALLFFGLVPVADFLVHHLEDRFPRPAAGFDMRSVAGIIVLGGARDGSGWDREEIGGLNAAAERMTESVALARLYPGIRIIFTGGSAAAYSEYPPEAEVAKRIYLALGVDAGRLTLEAASRTTHENAVFTARLLHPQPDQTWLLLTSAAHMPRAVGTFRKEGFNVVAWPVDYRTTVDLSLTDFSTSIPEQLVILDNAAHEYLGLLAYYLSGRSTALFPRP